MTCSFSTGRGLLMSRKRKSRGAKVSQKVKAKIMARDGHKCVRCDGTHNLTVDHIKPKAEGGTNHQWNLQTMCEHCNRIKGAKSVSYLDPALYEKMEARVGPLKGDA